MRNSDILVYTANTGGYESNRNDDVLVMTESPFIDPMRSARMHKCLTPDFWGYEYSVWIDGNTSLKVSPEYLIEKLGDDDIMVFEHWRDCIYDEAIEEIIECEHLGKPKQEIDVIMEQMERYRRDGYPHHNGLAATTYVIRRHNKHIEEFNNHWWAEICKGSKQDQLSFDYSAWAIGVKIGHFDHKGFDIHRNNNYFSYKPHGF